MHPHIEHPQGRSSERPSRVGGVRATAASADFTIFDVGTSSGIQWSWTTRGPARWCFVTPSRSSDGTAAATSPLGGTDSFGGRVVAAHSRGEMQGHQWTLAGEASRVARATARVHIASWMRRLILVRGGFSHCKVCIPRAVRLPMARRRRQRAACGDGVHFGAKLHSAAGVNTSTFPPSRSSCTSHGTRLPAGSGASSTNTSCRAKVSGEPARTHAVESHPTAG